MLSSSDCLLLLLLLLLLRWNSRAAGRHSITATMMMSDAFIDWAFMARCCRIIFFELMYIIYIYI